MAIGKRRPKQKPMWIRPDDLAPRSGHSFYTPLNRLLEVDGFDALLEQECAPFFAAVGRPSIPPGVYFRMLFIGYLEGFPSDRGIAWHCADSLSLRDFLGYQLHEKTPDHSSMTIWRQRLPLKLYNRFSQRILALVHKHGLINAYATGVDSSTIEANASLRRLARKDSGASYQDYVKELMREDGKTPKTLRPECALTKSAKARAFTTRIGSRRLIPTRGWPTGVALRSDRQGLPQGRAYQRNQHRSASYHLHSGTGKQKPATLAW